MPTRLIRSEYAVVSLFRAHSDSAFRVFPSNLALSVRTTRTLSARKRRPTSLILSSWILPFCTHLSKVCDVIPSHFSAMAFGTIAQDFGLSSKFFPVFGRNEQHSFRLHLRYWRRKRRIPQTQLAFEAESLKTR